VPLKPDEAETFPASSLLVRRISIASLHPCTKDSDGAETCNARLGLVCRVGTEEAATESQVKTATRGATAEVAGSRRWPTRRRHGSSGEEAADEAQRRAGESDKLVKDFKCRQKPPRGRHRRRTPAAAGGAARVVSTKPPESINKKTPKLDRDNIRDPNIYKRTPTIFRKPPNLDRD
jgi:hypothetical protein